MTRSLIAGSTAIKISPSNVSSPVATARSQSAPVGFHVGIPHLLWLPQRPFHVEHLYYTRHHLKQKVIEYKRGRPELARQTTPGRQVTP